MPFSNLTDDILRVIAKYIPFSERLAFLLIEKSFYSLLVDEFLLEKFIYYIAIAGEDNLSKAENLLKIHSSHNLILSPYSIKDAAGREFSRPLSAYEYAYWALDIEMCDMMMHYLDEKSKKDARILANDIEQNGLAFSLYEKKFSHSKHFSFDLFQLVDTNHYVKQEEIPRAAFATLPINIAQAYCSASELINHQTTLCEPWKYEGYPTIVLNKGYLTCKARTTQFYNSKSKRVESWFVSDRPNSNLVYCQPVEKFRSVSGIDKFTFFSKLCELRLAERSLANCRYYNYNKPRDFYYFTFYMSPAIERYCVLKKEWQTKVSPVMQRYMQAPYDEKCLKDSIDAARWFCENPLKREHDYISGISVTLRDICRCWGSFAECVVRPSSDILFKITKENSIKYATALSWREADQKAEFLWIANEVANEVLAFMKMVRQSQPKFDYPDVHKKPTTPSTSFQFMMRFIKENRSLSFFILILLSCGVFRAKNQYTFFNDTSLSPSLSKPNSTTPKYEQVMDDVPFENQINIDYQKTRLAHHFIFGRPLHKLGSTQHLKSPSKEAI